MNRVSAYGLLSAELNAYKEFGFEELAKLVGEDVPQSTHMYGGEEYAIVIAARWLGDDQSRICLSGTVGLTAWNVPHDRFDDPVVVKKSATE